MSTSDQSPPSPPPGGVTSIKTGMVQLLYPQKEAEGAGVVRHFVWRGEETEIAGDVSRGDAGLVISRVEVRAPMPMGITHRLLHRVPLGDILAEARADIARHGTAASLAPEAPPDFEGPIPPGRVLITDELLCRVANAYLEETVPGKDRAVLQRLEERFGRPKGTIRTWLARARSEGWLGPAIQGRMGAEPGPKMYAWIEEQFADHQLQGPR